MRIISTLIKIILITAVVLFCALNLERVQVQYFFDRPPIEAPLFVVMLAAMFLGIVLASILYLTDRFKLARKNKQLKKELKNAENEIKKLRNLPLSKESSAPEPARKDERAVTADILEDDSDTSSV